MTYAPVILFVYARLAHTQRTIEALGKNLLADKTDLIVYSDAAKDKSQEEAVAKVRHYLKTVDGFKSVMIIEREKNWGLANSILSGVSETLASNSSVIVLEDDLVTSPYFLNFMNEGLVKYETIEAVASIHGYVYPTINAHQPFFLRGSDCWGWATWERAWKTFNQNGLELLEELEKKKLSSEFDFESSYPYTKMLKDQIAGKNNSWAVRWKASTFLNNQLVLYYHESLVQNIGNDNTGTHSDTTDVFEVKLANTYNGIPELIIEENKNIRKKFSEFYKSTSPSFLQKVKAKLKSLRN